MPELPEVETTRRGISPYIEDQTINQVIVRNYLLRWPIPKTIANDLANQHVHKITRRAKYLLFHCNSGTLIIHLGMSGNLRILNGPINIGKHDHIDIKFNNGYMLRFNDPRRFGAFVWTEDPINNHILLHHLGPEPLSSSFSSEYLIRIARGRRSKIKNFIMNSKFVVGIGNIYANESLFLSNIHPETITGTLDQKKLSRFVTVIKLLLEKAIHNGGTTLKNFKKSDGKPGYFAQYLNVYGRNKCDCYRCGSKIQLLKGANRATYYCPICQIKD
ncbi:MAG: bifunctional DNA-formamidopyrimidine glycosylase/DNA-(apurinic or apyrimidinic site) lyase [Piscirickettsiaceae bacterium]|nr:bifunctional DNA-formamidopyrimidine glycosylase/DNA-(apurinic or apyrimidinic site) lyase [Piscirickettsiaceae bacterium]